MTQLILREDQTGVFLFRDHKIAKASFPLPETCPKVSMRTFLLFLGKNDYGGVSYRTRRDFGRWIVFTNQISP